MLLTGLGWVWGQNGTRVNQFGLMGIDFEIHHEEGGEGDYAPWFSNFLLDSKRLLKY